MADFMGGGGRGGGGRGQSNGSRRRRGGGVGGGGRHPRNTNSNNSSSNRRNIRSQNRSDSAEAGAQRTGKQDDVLTESEIVASQILSSMDCGVEAPSGLENLLEYISTDYKELLLEALGKDTVPGYQGPLLAAACERGNDEMADLLIRYGADPNHLCVGNTTPLLLACLNGQVQCVRLLLGLPETLRGPVASCVGGTPIAASTRPKLATPNALIEACRGRTEGTAMEVTRELLKADAELPLVPESNSIAAHAAAASGLPGVLEILLSMEPQTIGREVKQMAELQMSWRNNEGLTPLQVAEKRCETDMQREEESRAHGGMGGGGNGRRSSRRGGVGRGGARNSGRGGGRGSGRGSGAPGGGGSRGHAGAARGAGGRGWAWPGSDETRSESSELSSVATSEVTLTAVVGGDPEGLSAAERGGEERPKGGFGCVVVIAEALGIRDTLYGDGSLRIDTVREGAVAHFGLHRILEDIRIQVEELDETNSNQEELLTDYTNSIMAYLAGMYKAVVKPSRNSHGPRMETSSGLLAKLIMPRDGSPYPLDDVSASVLVRFVAHTGANPYVVRHIILMLTEIANTPSKDCSAIVEGTASAESGGARSRHRSKKRYAGAKEADGEVDADAREEVELDKEGEAKEAVSSGIIEEKEERGGREQGGHCETKEEGEAVEESGPPCHAQGFKTMPCCLARRAQVAKGGKMQPVSPGKSGPPAFHVQACLAVWEEVCTCILRLGKMLLYGLQGQQEGLHGEMLYEREGALFDALWELVFRTLLPHAGEAAKFLPTAPGPQENPARAILMQTTGKMFDALWSGLEDALEVIEGAVSGSEPDRFGALLRGYLVYLHLVDDRLQQYQALLKVVRDHRVETGLAGGDASATGGYGGGGGRRVGRSGGRNPKNILTVLAADVSLGIPEAFRELVVKHSGALEEILDAGPVVLESRLSVLLRIEGAVDTPQKLDYIVSAMENRAGGGNGGVGHGGLKRLELSVNRMAEPYETVDMAMQQLAAAPPRAMTQQPHIKFVNEPGEGDGPLRELIDMLSEIFRAKRTLTPDEVAVAAANEAAGVGSSAGASTPRDAPVAPSTVSDAASDTVVGNGGEVVSATNPNAATLQETGGSPSTATAGATARTSPEDERTPTGDVRSGERVNFGGGGLSREPNTGFWRHFPMFRVYEPDPVAVVPMERGSKVSLSPGLRGGSSGAPAGRNSDNPTAQAALAAETTLMEGRTRFFRAAGRVIALSLVTGTPLGVVFPEAFWSVLLGNTPTWEECCGRDTEYLASMRAVLEHKFGSGEEGNGMELFYAITERDREGKLVDVPLLPGGDNKRVTDRNKKEFVLMATRRRCLGGAESAISSMRSGMADVIPKNLLSVLLPSELATLVSGPQGQVDLKALRANVWYVDRDFGADHIVLRWFWEWAEGLTEPLRRKLLLFWSGSSRVPPFGFDDDTLNEDHRWAIDKGAPHDACPQVSTCDRRMGVPNYSSKAQLVKYMDIAIKYGYLGYTKT